MNKRTPRKLICVALALVLTLSLLPMSAFAAGEVAIDETNFPDPVFRQYVLDNCDFNSNGFLSADEVAHVLWIDCSPEYHDDPKISSLKGIEYFSDLGYLDCSWNSLTSLDVSKNSALSEINCSLNQLTSLNIGNNTSLTTLDCGNNQLPSLNLSAIPSLTTLKCGSNQLSSLDLSAISSLTTLDCGSNPLSVLNLSAVPDLTSLECGGDLLKELDLSRNSELTFLNCGFNFLSTLDLSNNRKLEKVYCIGSALSEINIQNCTALRLLYCWDNALTSLDLSQNSALTHLECGGNPLTSLDVSHNPALEQIGIKRCKVTALDLSNNPALEYLTVDENQLTSLDLSKNSSLTSLSSGANSYTVNKHKGFDYTTLPGKFDVTKVSNVKGGKFDTAKHTFSFDDGVTEATYDYATGNSNAPTVSFKLVYSGSDVPVTPSKNPFTDVPADQYYYEPVQWAVKNGITSGVSKDKFGPNAPCTRGQIVTFLWAAAGRPEPTSTTNPFRDVSSKDYFYKAVLWAVENKITAGASPDRFAPHQTCTRAQTVTFLWASQGRPASSTKVQFTDVSAKDYFADSVAWAYENGVTSGVGGGRFGSYNTCTRGQIVTFLYKTFN